MILNPVFALHGDLYYDSCNFRFTLCGVLPGQHLRHGGIFLQVVALPGGSARDPQ